MEETAAGRLPSIPKASIKAENAESLVEDNCLIRDTGTLTLSKIFVNQFHGRKCANTSQPPR
jgi:hypothetical protein